MHSVSLLIILCFINLPDMLFLGPSLKDSPTGKEDSCLLSGHRLQFCSNVGEVSNVWREL